MAARKGRRRKRDSGAYPGWVYGLFGLAVGLSVAAAVWVSDRRAAVTADLAPAPSPASLESALDANGETAPAVAEEPPPAELAAKRFEFYDMLPNFEVIVPEEDSVVIQDTEPKAIDQPGTYILQAGSFSTHDDADRRRAQLALQGIESTIQKVTIDDKTYHRVRIGPVDDLDELNVLRSRLHAAKIDVLRIRMGD